MKETLSSISKRIGVSSTTISRVLSGQSRKYRISESTQKKVLDEAKRCNYTPNIIARNLRTKKTNTIGLILPSVANPFFADLSSVIITDASANNYTTIVLDSLEDEEHQSSNIATLLSRRVDGIIAAPCGADAKLLEEVNKKNIPVICVDRFYEDSQLPYVTTNNYTGSFEATNHLIINGHKRIACIQGIRESTPNKKRVAGYLDALKKVSLEKNAIIVGNEFSLQNGYLETKLLLNRAEPPTAILALSNTIGLGALKAIREANLHIPYDISLVTYDDNKYMDYLTPPITRIGQPVEEMAKLATKLLFESIETEKRLNTQIQLAPSLIIRESVMDLITE